MIKQPILMLCCDCGYAFDTDKMFIKQYQSTAICLCKKCAEKLLQDMIDDKNGYNDTMNKPEMVDWSINSVAPDANPVWTEEHIDELLDDFYIIPKDQ